MEADIRRYNETYGTSFTNINEVAKHMYEELTRERKQKLEQQHTESTLACKRCGKKTVIFMERQLRSSDEAMSTMCYCKTCHAKWMIS